MAAATNEGVEVTSTRRTKAADKAVGHLSRLIDLRKVAPGDTLPSAAQIAAEIDVNRSAVLQALQILQHDGLVLVRPGRGGARVIPRDERPPAQRLARANAKQEGIMKLHLLREILEAGIARHVATLRLSPQEVKRAKELLGRMRHTTDRDSFIALDAGFHELLGDASGSEMLAMLATALRTLNIIALDAVEISTERLVATNVQHELILDAICRGAAGTAAELAHQHASEAMAFVVEELGWQDAAAANGHTRRARTRAGAKPRSARRTDQGRSRGPK